MCGRYFINVLPETLKSEFGAQNLLEYAASYNLTPSQMAPVICDVRGARHLISMRRGLIPAWAKDPKMGYKMINARSETVSEKPSFRQAFSRRRCIVPMSGYYEWKSLESGKQPFAIVSADERPLAAAGLWEKWRSAERETIISFSIVTRPAAGNLQEVHHRMPVLLDDNSIQTWLYGDQTEAQKLMHSGPLPPVAVYAVSTAVNNPRNNSPELLHPIADTSNLLTRASAPPNC